MARTAADRTIRWMDRGADASVHLRDVYQEYPEPAALSGFRGVCLGDGGGRPADSLEGATVRLSYFLYGV